MQQDKRSSVRIGNNSVVKHAYFVFKKAPKSKEDLLEFEISNISHNGLKGTLPKDINKTIESGLKLPISIVFNNNRTLNLMVRVVWSNAQNNKIEFGLHFLGSLY